MWRRPVRLLRGAPRPAARPRVGPRPPRIHNVRRGRMSSLSGGRLPKARCRRNGNPANLTPILPVGNRRDRARVGPCSRLMPALVVPFPDMPPMVSVRDLRKRYGPVEAVRGISFEIQRGEIFGLLGPNGAGKTTTIECILGLREPDAGTIEIAGLDARHDPAAVRERVGAA